MMAAGADRRAERTPVATPFGPVHSTAGSSGSGRAIIAAAISSNRRMASG